MTRRHAALLVFLLLPLGAGCPSPTATGPGTPIVRPPTDDDDFEQAVEALTKSTDVQTCRTALQQINLDLTRHPERRPPALTEEQKQAFQDRDRFGLDAAELAEADNTSYTLLDAHQLEMAFLLHDAARALELEEAASPEKAAAAFGWVVRQVRLHEQAGEPLPPQFVLRRGYGTSLERALIFLQLLEQVGGKEGLAAGLVGHPGDQGPRFWACGVVLDAPAGKGVYLFDPRLGLPLPGPGGQGVATLAAVQAEPELLKQLTVDDKHPYDVTAEQARASALYLAAPLSALAPRMRPLEERLRGASLEVSLPDPLETLKRLEATKAAVHVWKPAVRVQRRFWSPEEGGTDNSQPPLRMQRTLELVPWEVLPKRVQDLPGEPGKRLQFHFLRPFAEMLFNPNMPRELVLRGRFADAAQDLVKTRDRVREQKGKLANATDLDEKVKAWTEKIIAATGEQIRAEERAKKAGKNSVEQAALDEALARVDAVWKEGQEPLTVLIEGSTAAAREADVTYLLALCMHEQAERLQARNDRLARANKLSDADKEAGTEAWRDAVSWWDRHALEDPAPGPAAAARRWRARAREALGERDEARQLLEDLSGPLTDPEKTARLYLAQRLKKR